ncbi:hypothetical protein [Streptomyces sp. NPDC088258]|uniref:hypothetical protein n=1 Tax=Streptomyces sp. NPDC088258 TaxID=3365849 RepID=UPI00380271FA
MTAVGEPRPGSGPPDGREGDPDQRHEQELRILLERAVPRLPDPESRWADVRERVVRARRRRRTVGAAAATVTAFVLAGVVLPSALRGGSERIPPAAPAPSLSHPEGDGRGDGDSPDGGGGGRGDGGRDASPAPSRPGGQGGRVHFPELNGVSLRLLAGWRALEYPEAVGSGPYSHTVLVNGPVAGRSPECVEGEAEGGEGEGCGPMASLLSGGALVGFAPAPEKDRSVVLTGAPVLRPVEALSPVCLGAGGVAEYTALLAGPSDTAELTVSLCASGDAPEAVEDVHTMIASADFGTETDRNPSEAATAPARNGPTSTPPGNAK